jgi:hypothetical protein
MDRIDAMPWRPIPIGPQRKVELPLCRERLAAADSQISL